MKVIAFDIATKTGVAFGVAGGIPRATTIDFDKRLTDAQRFAKMLQATRVLLAKFQPDIVAFEAPIGGPRTSHFLVGIAACFQGEATRLGYSPVKISIATVRKHFLGATVTSKHFAPSIPLQSRGKTLTAEQIRERAKKAARDATKSAVVARCFALGWEVRNDDEADACAIWDYASATLGRAQAAPLGKLFTHNARAKQ
jgi:hypothetical protein